MGLWVRGDLLEKNDQHTANTHDVGAERAVGALFQISQVPCEEQLIIHLVGRADGNLKGTSEVGATPSPASLGDVRGNRRRRPANLTGQPVLFCFRERGRGAVDIERELMGVLPDAKLPVILHDAVLSREWGVPV